MTRSVIRSPETPPPLPVNTRKKKQVKRRKCVPRKAVDKNCQQPGIVFRMTVQGKGLVVKWVQGNEAEVTQGGSS